MSIGINSYNNYATETANTGKSTSKESAASESKQYGNASEYAKYLSGKYAYFGKTASVYGVPTTVTVSKVYLQKCANDPEEAKVLERNLSSVPECTRQGEARLKAAPGSPVTIYRNVVIDENGHISSVSGCTNDPDGKIARENALKQAQKKKDREKRLAEKRAEKKDREEKLEELRAKRKAERESMQTREVTVIGNDMRDMTEKMIKAISNSNNSALSGTIGIDIEV